MSLRGRRCNKELHIRISLRVSAVLLGLQPLVKTKIAVQSSHLPIWVAQSRKYRLPILVHV